MKAINFLIAVLFTVVSIKSHAEVTVTVKCDGDFWGRIVLHYTDRGISSSHDSGEGIGKGYTKTYTFSDDVNNMKISTSTNVFLGVYDDACETFIGSAGGTFTLGGTIHLEKCDWVPTVEGIGLNVSQSATFNFAERTAGNNTHLHSAVKNGESGMINTLLQKGSPNMEVKNSKGYTPLHEAVAANKESIVDLLIRKSANVSALTAKGQSPIFIALTKGHTKIIKKLIDAGAVPTAPDVEKAIIKNDKEVVKMFMDAGTQPNEVCNVALSKNKVDIIMMAINDYGAAASNAMFNKLVDARKYDAAENLIPMGIDLNLAMDHAVKTRSEGLISTLMTEGADANKAMLYGINNNNSIILDEAVSNNADPNRYLNEAMTKANEGVITTLLDYGADSGSALSIAIKSKKSNLFDIVMNAGPTVTNTHIIESAILGNAQQMGTLLENGGDADLALTEGLKAGHTQAAYITACINNGAQADAAMPIAIDNNDAAMVKLLLDNGASASDPSFIQKATSNKNVSIVSSLLESGAQANDAIKNAVTVNSSEIVTILLDNGADGSSSELLKASVTHNNPVLTSQLIKAGADPSSALQATLDANATSVLQLLVENQVDVSNSKYLVTALSRKQTGVVKILLNNDNDPEYTDNLGNNYAHMAAKIRYMEIIPMLAAAGTDMNGLNENGNAPIHEALQEGRKGRKTVESLIEQGADVTVSTGDGKKCLELAKGRKTKKALEKAGAPN